jgi:phosphoribosylanthranilate isomerase
MTNIKICGLMTPEHARVAAEAGARYIGLVFAPSKRRVSIEQARNIVAALHDANAQYGTQVEVVGVFVDAAAGEINRIAAEVGLHRAQLSGHEPASITEAISVPVIKAVRFDGHWSEGGWLAHQHAPLLVDAHVPGSFGGAGVTGDWARAAELTHHTEVWLAGGLTPHNVVAAIRQVHPAVVDVSSGVETDGAKDADKIRAFIASAKQQNQEPSSERS